MLLLLYLALNFQLFMQLFLKLKFKTMESLLQQALRQMITSLDSLTIKCNPRHLFSSDFEYFKYIMNAYESRFPFCHAPVKDENVFLTIMGRTTSIPYNTEYCKNENEPWQRYIDRMDETFNIKSCALDFNTQFDWLLDLSRRAYNSFLEKVIKTNHAEHGAIGIKNEADLIKSLKAMRDVFDSKKSSDPVNKPAHYTSGKIEVIDFIEDQKLDFSLANAVKYICRAGKKDPSKEVEDLEKGAWYLQRKIKNLKDVKETKGK